MASSDSMEGGNAELGFFAIAPKWSTLVVVGTSTVMSALDTSIVNIALPAIARSTKAPMATIEWVMLAYLLAVTSSLLVFGRLADIYGKRTICITGQIVFGVASLLCGLSGRIELLILSRALQGIGAAMLFAVGPALLTSAFPPSERGRALGLQAMMTYLGLSAGPVLGGVLTQKFGWPSIFLVNLPISAALVAFSARVLPIERRKTGQSFDPYGTTLVGIGLSTLLIALTKTHTAGFASPVVLGLLLSSAMAWIAFFLVERRVTHPALDVRLFSNFTFSASTLAALMSYAAAAGMNFLMPFFLLRGLGLQESRAGLLLMSTPLSMMLLSGLSGALSDKVGVRLPSTIGMVVMSLGVIVLSRVGVDSAPSSVVLAGIIIGVGTGLFTSPNNSAIMSAAPASQRGVAGAVLAAARTTGFSIGTATACLIYATSLGGHPSSASKEAIVNSVHQGLTAVIVLCIAAAVLSAVRTEEKRAEA